MKPMIVGKQAPPFGKAPAVVLINPKYPHNVGTCQGACSCFGIGQLWWTGNRVTLNPENGERLPREERMRGYKDVTLVNFDRPLDQFPKSVTPVAIEVRLNSESLPDFVHPERAVYVFGPEDGTLPKYILSLCHRFLVIPSRHCLNLAAAVNVILYDRMAKSGQWQSFNIGAEESRAWAQEPDVHLVDGVELRK